MIGLVEERDRIVKERDRPLMVKSELLIENVARYRNALALRGVVRISRVSLTAFGSSWKFSTCYASTLLMRHVLRMEMLTPKSIIGAPLGPKCER